MAEGNMTTGERIKAARKKAGLTQTQLGERLGVPYQSIFQWETNKRKPKYESLCLVATALGISLPELVGLNGQDDDGDATRETRNVTFKLAQLPEITMAITGMIRLGRELGLTAGQFEEAADIASRMVRNAAMCAELSELKVIMEDFAWTPDSQARPDG